MAVPKKKISFSRTRKKIYKKNKLLIYKECKNCLNFIKLHHKCIFCSPKNLSDVIEVHSNFSTNINKLFKNKV